MSGYFKAPDVADDIPVGVPLIGYDNSNAAGIFTSGAQASHPDINLQNPATHLTWKATVTTGDVYIIVALGLNTDIDYLAIAKHNLGSSAALVAVEGDQAADILLHFNGTDASTTITESAPFAGSRVWTAAGNAQLDTAQSKFGGASLLCDGTGDWVSTPAVAAFVMGTNDFTIDCWVRPAAIGGGTKGICGQSTDANNVMRLAINASGNVFFQIAIAGSVSTVQSPGVLSTNTWYHIAVVRSGGSTVTLYIDGVAVATTTEDRAVPAWTGSFFVGQDTNSAGWNGWIDEFKFLNNWAYWTANFTPPKREWGLITLVETSDDNAQIMLHFDGANGSTSIVDSNSLGVDHAWTAAGNAQLDDATKKFGVTSLKLDGTGDYVSAPDDSNDFAMGSQDFTVDFWIRINSLAADMGLWAQITDANNSIAHGVTTAGVLAFGLYVGGAFVVQLNSAAGAVVTNTWYHIAVVRNGSAWTMYKDGVSIATATYTPVVPDFTGVFNIGQDTFGNYTNGWIDEFRLTIGSARWTANFTPPTAQAEAGSLILEDTPLLFRWNALPLASIFLHMRPDIAVPEVAVLYAGTLLVLERSITIGEGHVPISYGRETTTVNGISESGNFLGRIVLTEYKQSKAHFEWFTPDFYRSNIDAFLAAAQSVPFFWVWNPEEYPEEVGFVWLTNNAEPETDPVTRRVSLTLEMRGVA